MTSPARPARVLGAYAAQPDTIPDLETFYREVLALPSIDGLEISWAMPTWERDAPIVAAAMKAHPRPGRHVVTLVGAEVGLAQKGAGLAALDPDARRTAIDLVARARDWVESVTSAQTTIAAIELHALPSVEPALAAEAGRALAASLAEIAAWDWGGTEIVIEHCDARSDERPWRKGLLPLELEIAAVAAGARTPLGIAVNWGRSAIEGRSADTPTHHVARLRQAGCLRGLIFSGATDRDGLFGEAWGDVHPPFHEQLGDSIMDAAHLDAAMTAAGDALLFDGVKIAVRPLDLPLADRIALLRDAAAMLPARA